MNTLMENGVQLTLEQWMPQIFQKPTVGASEHLVRTFPFPEKEKDLRETEAVSSEKYLESLPRFRKMIDLNGSSTKMLRECLAVIKDLTSYPYSLKWNGGGYDIEWQILNTRDFGVPQNRERVYTVGHLRRRGSRKIFPICGTNEQNHIQLTAEKGCISYRIKEAVKKGYAIAYPGDSINLSLPNSKTRRGRVGRKVAQTLDTSCYQGTIIGKRIRRFTPKECFRLQGWDDDYFERAQFINSDVQLYKQAGNGVTVTVVKAIAEKM